MHKETPSSVSIKTTYVNCTRGQILQTTKTPKVSDPKMQRPAVFHSAFLADSDFSSFLGLPNDFWASRTGMYASLVFLKTSMAALSGSRGLTSFFSTSSNLAVAHGAVPTALEVFGASIVSMEASSLEAYQEWPHAMHSNWIHKTRGKSQWPL